jgi:hypothetical protein
LATPDWLPWPLARTAADALPKLPLWHLQPGAHGAAAAAGGAAVQCPKGGPLAQFGDAKLAVAVHARELSRRLLAASASAHGSGSSSGGAVGSHAVDPGRLNNAFGRSASAPPAKQSLQAKVMGYLPPVWLAQKALAWLKAKLNVASSWASWVDRTPLHGALVVLHVATHPSLGGGGAGSGAGGVGGVFSDGHGALWGCGKQPQDAARECGRVPAAALPAAALNRTLSAMLFDRTTAVLAHHLTPLAA